ncbi:hypothetical protein Cgig2_030437 [Carnegiea gigantea]|uniref:Uncharacterized protein n=1 Tax=Carnegiea gigantea TaxID=171969 RepID=A0A9Q1KMF5_9CARY|nr:hypothetical protein Cgig2_030437 [Carnegiea gigantea]
MMLNQPRGGHVFNIDGAGSDGRPTPRYCSLAFPMTCNNLGLLDELFKLTSGWDGAGGTSENQVADDYPWFLCPEAELQMHDVKNVVVHNLSPGMVTTDLLMSGAYTKQAKFFINVLAEPPEVVAQYLVPKVRSIAGSGSTKPTYIRFLTGMKAYSQIFSRLAFGARRNRYVLED